MAGTQAEDRKWWPSKWGTDDTLGSFNMLGPELTLKAAKLIKTGKTYRLGIESTSKTPAWPPRSCEVTVMLPNQYGGTTLGENHMNFFDDRVSAWMGCGTQIDGLGHVGTKGVFYNGLKANEIAKVDGLTKLGVENYPPIVSRGVLLDMASFMGQTTLKGGTVFNRTEIMHCAKK